MSSTCPEFAGGWMAVRSKTRQEKYARFNVERQGYECYLPFFEDKRTGKEQVLFPSYLFVLTDGRWRSLQSTYGVLAIVLGQDGYPARMPVEAIQELKGRENKRGLVEIPRDKFAKDQMVRVAEGPFMGSLAIYQRMTGRDRVQVLISMLGAWVPTVVREKYVEAA